MQNMELWKLFDIFNFGIIKKNESLKIKKINKNRNNHTNIHKDNNAKKDMMF